MTKPTLEREFRQVLASLELLSYGSTQSWNSSGKGGKPGAKLLHSGMLGRVSHEAWLAEWRSAVMDVAVGRPDRRRDVLEAARLELEQAQRRQAPLVAGESEEAKRNRCVRDCQGLSAGEAAEAMRETARWVIKVRLGSDREPNQGREIRGVEDWRAKVQVLWGEGVSLREIGRRVEKSHEAVRQALRKAA